MDASTSASMEIPLWKGPAPFSRGTAADDIPTLTVFLPARSATPAPAVLICPGGGYGGLALQHEGNWIGVYFRDRGVAAFVLKYRLPGKGYPHPVPLLDGQRALRLIRRRSTEWAIDSGRIGVMGFSAGGHLASTLETHFDGGQPGAADAIECESCRPDFAVLVYPVITLQVPGVTHEGSKSNLLGPNPDPALVASLSSDTQVTLQTPPTLLVHAHDDGAVPIENSRLFLAALARAGVAGSLQEYPAGGHGFGYGKNPDPSPKGWLDAVGGWLRGQGFLP